MLGIVWWSLVAIGVVLVLGAAARREQRILLLTAAAAVLAVAGVLAILSIGLVFVAAGAGCAAWAAHERRTAVASQVGDAPAGH